MNRRTFLAGTSMSLSLLLGKRLGLSAGDFTPLQRIARSETPLTLETPLAAFDRFITPNELFYVRNHFPTPTLEVDTWRLRVSGAVAAELDLTLDDIRRMPARTLPATLECAGNSRSALVPAVRGLQWGNGAVSTAEWTGVPLIDVLYRAGLRSDAVEVVLEGADRGEVTSEPRSPGVIHYARGLGMTKACHRDVLLAYRMNGANLSREHGFPLRAVVPGWYGMASVKWLARIVVVTRPFNGFFQSLDYSIFQRRDGLVSVTPITAMQVKAIIAGPTSMQRIAPNTNVRIHGVAWTGESTIARVEVSTDDGRTWTAARLLDNARAHSWRLWEHPWRSPAQPGRVPLMARATDARGNTQPLTRDTDRRNYMINHVMPVEVDVR